MQHLCSQILNLFSILFNISSLHTPPSFEQCCLFLQLQRCWVICLAQLHKTLWSISYLYFVGILSTGCLSIMWRQILLKLFARAALTWLDTLISSWSCRTHYYTISVHFFLIVLHLPSIYLQKASMSPKLIRSSPVKTQRCLWAAMLDLLKWL